MILLILRGVPASGKSTHAKELQRQGWTVVNRDSIRFSLYGKYWGRDVNEDVVTIVEDAAISAALAANTNVVVDATNLHAKSLRTKLSLASRYGAWVHYMDFPVSQYEAINRDGDRLLRVGGDVIKKFFSRYKINTETGALPTPPEPLPKFEKYVPDLSKPLAYIVDTDGTVADSEGVRSPYDTSRYALDKAREHVCGVTYSLAPDYKIIALSGRDEEFREVTEQWWIDNALDFNEFYMRPQGDKRMDAIIKYELFKKHIEPNYNVLGAFDDRPQVIRMWRSIGVPVFDVGNGVEF